MLLGPDGNPMEIFAKKKGIKKVSDPLLGEVAPGYNAPRGPNPRMPLDNTLQFNTDRLTLADYRLMRDHYQINSSLSVLSFMLHQADWKIVGDDPKAVKHCQYNMEKIWSRLVRAMSQAFWAGYSSNALQWENDDSEGKVMLTKIKDLPQEECRVKWKKVPAVGGQARTRDTVEDETLSTRGGVGKRHNTTKIYDGIVQQGYDPIPVSNSFWYPVFMEHGNMYGRKLLNSAFQPWFFSQLIHMYSNRYFERFGEPVMVGRAPFGEKVNVNGTEVEAYKMMQAFQRQVRNGASAILPSDMKMNGTDDSGVYEYTMEYLESQMRGADFERYMTRLDEEMSLALFTPLLLLRTAESGSFNLGVGHTQMYLWQLNAILEDWKEYIDKYIVAPMAYHNDLVSPGKRPPEIKFRKLGKSNVETVRLVLGALVGAGKVMPDIKELGQEVGMTLEEIEQVVEPPTEPVEDDENKGAARPKGEGRPVPINPTTKTPKDTKRDNRISRPDKNKAPKGTDKRAGLKSGMSKRLSEQLRAGRTEPDVGCHRQFSSWLESNWSEDGALWENSIDEWFASCQSTVTELFEFLGVLDVDDAEKDSIIESTLESFFQRVERVNYANEK